CAVELPFRFDLAVGKLPTPGSDLSKKAAHMPAHFQPDAAPMENNLAAMVSWLEATPTRATLHDR
ncbi:MAG: hypothetical protein Q7U75_03990, partial [Desulfobacterales bacterium]|nr:hypothetical protein [Desulfobacterales bacterium]